MGLCLCNSRISPVLYGFGFVRGRKRNQSRKGREKFGCYSLFTQWMLIRIGVTCAPLHWFVRSTRACIPSICPCYVSLLTCFSFLSLRKHKIDKKSCKISSHPQIVLPHKTRSLIVVMDWDVWWSNNKHINTQRTYKNRALQPTIRTTIFMRYLMIPPLKKGLLSLIYQHTLMTSHPQVLRTLSK